MSIPKIRFKDKEGLEFPSWELSSIENFVEKIHSGRSKKNKTGCFDLYGATGLIGRSDSFDCNGEFVLAARVGSIGVLNLPSGKYAVSDNTLIFEHNELTIPQFLYYRLSLFDWYSVATGTSQKVVSAGRLKKSKLFWCSPEEQQKIASFFSTLDQKIELNERKLEVLEKLKKGLMQKFFKQELRFKSPENRDYPEWEVQKLEKLCSTFKSGSSITQKSIFEAGAYPVYGGNGLRGYTDTYTHDGEYALIGRQGALCGNLKYVKGKTYISEHAIAVQANSENSTQWLYYRLKEMNLNKLSESSAQPGLSAKKLKEILINTPCLEEQIRIANFLACFDEQIKLCTNKLFMLQQLKRSFLRQMFV
jgi:restriction endonuclease S subunit